MPDKKPHALQVVVVDDDEIGRYLVKRVVESMNIEATVLEYDDGDQFIEVMLDESRMLSEIGQPPPHFLVLLDINMPRMDGFKVLEKLDAEFSESEQILFITMYTSSNHAQDRADAANYNFVKDYIVKPVSAEKLGTLITKLYPDGFLSK